jgi:hypothetical protein
VAKFRCIWSVDIQAGDPESAARAALALQRDVDNTATIFTVWDMDRDKPVRHTVDVAPSIEHRVRHGDELVYLGRDHDKARAAFGNAVGADAVTRKGVAWHKGGSLIASYPCKTK